MCGQRQGWVHSLTETTFPFPAPHPRPGSHACAHSTQRSYGHTPSAPAHWTVVRVERSRGILLLKLREVESSVRLQRSVRSVPGGHFRFPGVVLGSHRRGAMIQ